MSQFKLPFTSRQNRTVYKLLAILAVSAIGLTFACEDIEDPDSALMDDDRGTRGSRSYNTIKECEEVMHKGDGWKSLCDKHGGWGNPNDPASGMTCKSIDCERNPDHDVSVYFWTGGCYCKDGYRGPDPDADLDPLPPGCKEAMSGKDTFCQKDEDCRGTGTRTVKGYSCRDVDKGFGPLVCSGLFSDRDWKQMRADCCFDPDEKEEPTCTPLHETCKSNDDCCTGLECKVRTIGQAPICSAKGKPKRTRISDDHGGAGGRVR